MQLDTQIVGMVDHRLQRVNPPLLQRTETLCCLAVTVPRKVAHALLLSKFAHFGQVLHHAPRADPPQKLLEVRIAKGLYLLDNILLRVQRAFAENAPRVVVGDQSFRFVSGSILLDRSNLFRGQRLQLHIGDSRSPGCAVALLSDLQRLVCQIGAFPEHFADTCEIVRFLYVRIQRRRCTETGVIRQLDPGHPVHPIGPDTQVDGIPSFHLQRQAKRGRLALNAGRYHRARHALRFVRDRPPVTMLGRLGNGRSRLTTAHIGDVDSLAFCTHGNPPQSSPIPPCRLRAAQGAILRERSCLPSARNPALEL